MGLFGKIGKAFRDAGKGLSKVPAIGPGLKAGFSLATAPIRLTADVASGKRIDKAVLTSLKEQVADVKDVAPYAQMAVSLVPGVGTGVAGAIGAASALAQGQPITKALAEGVKGALPGGPAAKAAFSLGAAAIQGKKLDLQSAALDALPIDEKQKQIVIRGLAAASDIAKGKRVDTSIINQARKLLPKEVQTGLDVGMALAHGQSLQKIATNVVANGIPIKGVNMKEFQAMASFVPKTVTVAAMANARNIVRDAARGGRNAKAIIAATKAAAKTNPQAQNGLKLLQDATDAQLVLDLNSKNPNIRGQAKAAVKTLAKRGDHAKLQTLNTKASALREAVKFSVDTRGFVRRVR